MLVSSWLIEGPEGQQIEVVQLDMGRADSVSFAWRENRRPITRMHHTFSDASATEPCSSTSFRGSTSR